MIKHGAIEKATKVKAEELEPKKPIVETDKKDTPKPQEVK